MASTVRPLSDIPQARHEHDDRRWVRPCHVRLTGRIGHHRRRSGEHSEIAFDRERRPGSGPPGKGEIFRRDEIRSGKVGHGVCTWELVMANGGGGKKNASSGMEGPTSCLFATLSPFAHYALRPASFLPISTALRCCRP